MKPVLTIAIPTMDNYDQLGWCLQTLLRYTEYPYRIVLIDNGCKGLVKRWVSDLNYKELHVLEPEKNLGWMGSINLALDSCDTLLFCMMNDDVCFLPGNREYWRILTNHLSDPAVGAVGPCSNYIAGTQALTEHNTPILFETSLIIGLCVVLRTDVLKDLGGLDESLPGGDDLDLSARLLAAGYNIRIDKHAYLHHHGQQTGRRIHGANYDSKWHQEATNNALVRKHGFRAWNEVYQAQWRLPERYLKVNDEDSETSWYEKQLENVEGLKGLNLGCGETKLGDSIGLDLRRTDEIGAGSQKVSDVAADTTADASDLPIQTSSQDYIVASHVLEHLIDPFKALQEWYRALRPNGHLFLTVPNHNDIPTILLDYTHLHAFTPESLQRVVESNGFTVDTVEPHSLGNIRLTARRNGTLHSPSKPETPMVFAGEL